METQNLNAKPNHDQLPAAVWLLLERVENIEKLLSGNKVSGQKYVNSTRACEILGIKKPTLYRETSAGNIPCYKSNGKGPLMFIPAELEAWMETNAIKKTSFDSLSEAEKSDSIIENQLLANQIMRGGSNG